MDRPLDAGNVAVPQHAHTPWTNTRLNGRSTPSPVPGSMPGYMNSSKLPLSAPGSSSSRKLSFRSWTTHKQIKYGRGKHADVELMPQPSEDPEDPLNWPKWRKDLNLFSLLVMVGLVGGMKTTFLTTNATMAARYHVSYVAVAALTGAPLVLSALSGLVSSVAARLWGRRPVYLAATLATFVGCVWNTAAGSSYSSCMGARLLQGLGWGVFDALVMASIQDTYFEHQRNLRVTLYNVMNIATTWGSPLVGGIASQRHGSFTVQFQILSGFFALAIPLMLLGAPETAFDRARAAVAPTPVSGFTLSRRWQPWRFRHRLTKTRVLEYLDEMRPRSFNGHVSKNVTLQIPRAMAAPTTILVFLLSFVPFCALWGYASSLSLFLTPKPLSTSPSIIGTTMTGPWILPTFVVTSLALYRGVHLNFTRLANCLIIGGGSSLALIGILSFGLGLDNFMSSGYSATPLADGNSIQTKHFFNADGAKQLSLALVSFQMGILAAGTVVLDAATRPSLARSASFTSSNMSIALRSIGDMHTGVVILRNLAIGIFTMAMPVAVSATTNSLKAVAIGLGVTQGVCAVGVIVAGYLFDESIWRADGRIMGLVDLSSLKLSSSFFDAD